MEGSGQGEDLRRLVLSVRSAGVATPILYSGGFAGVPQSCQFTVTYESVDGQQLAGELMKERAARCLALKSATAIELAPLAVPSADATINDGGEKEPKRPRVEATAASVFFVSLFHAVTAEKMYRNPHVVDEVADELRRACNIPPQSVTLRPNGCGAIDTAWPSWCAAARFVQTFHGRCVDNVYLQCRWDHGCAPSCPSLIACASRSAFLARASSALMSNSLWMAPLQRTSDACCCQSSSGVPRRQAPPGAWLPLVAVANMCEDIDALLCEGRNEFGPTGRCLLHDILEECHMCGDVTAYAALKLPPDEGDCVVVFVEMLSWSAASDVVRLFEGRLFGGRSLEAVWCAPDFVATLSDVSLLTVWRASQFERWQCVANGGYRILEPIPQDDIDDLIGALH